MTAEDVDELEQRRQPVAICHDDCLNGYFHDAQFESLAETLLRAEKAGSCAVGLDRDVRLSWVLFGDPTIRLR